VSSDIDSSTGFLYAVAATGERIGFDMCFAADCGLHISRCECENGPTPPHLGASAGVVTVLPPTAAVTSAA
jgi:hypothetical protein